MHTRSRYSTRGRCPTIRPQLETLEDRILLVAGFLDPAFGHFGEVTTDFLVWAPLRRP